MAKKVLFIDRDGTMIKEVSDYQILWVVLLPFF